MRSLVDARVNAENDPFLANLGQSSSRPFLDKTGWLDYLKLFPLAGLRRSAIETSYWSGQPMIGGKQSLA